ncbi:TadE/TadG family type IV pilus assembly protein [Actinomadura sp. 7K534]|uniref:TadE/TadG family type IV pilus assembly protein n=1 Tax=Actinomadura sp. 7K534 TaxID=2530366 RepID=UPI00104B60B3|nr:TadE/TadG family type IV pilus assembly protein [Actinomadura sp. 7K534]TDB85125.1 pilus assembly protein [Actinomadura sp. 7K534]
MAARRSRRPGDRGAVALEFAGSVPIAFFVIFLSFQAYISFTTVSRVENIARTGAREASQRYDPRLCVEYARNVRPAWLNDYRIEGGATTVDGEDAVYCRVEAKLPVLFKGVPLDYTVKRTVTMPLG